MMSKHFEEAKLVISVDVVYDPEESDNGFFRSMEDNMHQILSNYDMLYKNLKIQLQGFTCDDK
jgi:hypothetical protein